MAKPITATDKEFIKLNKIENAILSSTPIDKVLGKGSSFCYYTKKETFEKILKSKSIWVRTVDQMNDKKEFVFDRNLDKKRHHLLCFSNTKEEIIPMWYMYGGTKGDGVRIRLTPGLIRNLLKEIRLTTPNGKELSKDEYEIKCGWVYYQKDNCAYRHRGKTYIVKDLEDKRKRNKFYDGNIFIKSIHWEYEKEFRIVIINKCKKPYEYLVLDLSSIFNKLTFMYGPESRESAEDAQYSNSQLYIKMGL